MAVLAVFALALACTAERVASRWADALARSATVRVSASPEQLDAQVAAALEVLRTTPGVAKVRRLSRAEEEALLSPWLGPDLPLDALPMPALIEVVAGPEGIDAVGLGARLAGEAPGAVYDDHTRWRAPLAVAAGRVQALGLVALALIASAAVTMVALAAQSALAANARVIAALRLVGAQDVWIARAFVRRFTLRAGAGALLGTALGMAAVAALPQGAAMDGFVSSLGFVGPQWLWPLAVPFVSALAAFAATRFAAFRLLRETS
jgi:cell division transport system permease protein